MLLIIKFLRKERVLVCYVHCHLHFTSLVIKFHPNHFRNEITPLLKENDMRNYSQDLAMNPVREKGKPR